MHDEQCACGVYAEVFLTYSFAAVKCVAFDFSSVCLPFLDSLLIVEACKKNTA